MITIIDYGMGNLGSIKNMLWRLGFESKISSNPEDVLAAPKLILPGVGAFHQAMQNLHERGLVEPVKQACAAGTPLLGICLGMQLLTQGSEEGEPIEGLGLIPGRTRAFHIDEGLKVPHMGWNFVRVEQSTPLTEDLPTPSRFYFVHSYVVECERAENVLLTCAYGETFHAGICSGNVMGTQFHPEKSHRFGMKLLQNFAEKVHA